MRDQNLIMELSSFFVWYLYIFIIGIIGLPLSAVIFSDFKDKGYGFSKAIGIVLIGLPIWLLSSLKIVAFSETVSLIFLTVGTIVSIFLLSKLKFKINKYIIFEEISFFLILLIWSIIRSTNAKIEGTEKLMNIAFMNSIDKTQFFPPLDPWYSGGTINYYYMGHFFYTLLGKLTSLPVSITYNLSLNFIISQLFISLCSIFFKLFDNLKVKQQFVSAFLGSFIISFGGNLHYIYRILESFFKKEELTYFFSNSTRIIPFTINEFPAYSVVLGDLHGHYNVLPFTLLVLAISYVYYKIEIFSRRKLIFSLLISIFISLLYSINSWDFITINILFLLLNFFKVFGERKFLLTKIHSAKWIQRKLIGFLKKYEKYKYQLEFTLRMGYVGLLQTALVIPGMLVFLPYIVNFKPAIGGIGFAPLNQKSELLPWFLFWGMFIIPSVIFLLFYIFKNFEQKFKDLYWIAILNFTAVGLIIGVEFFFLKDLFFTANPDYYRTNTVFKFYYHAWILWGISAIYYSVQIISNNKQKFNFRKFTVNGKIVKVITTLLLTFIYTSSIIYIVRAVYDFYPTEKLGTGTLDGNEYLLSEHREDYLAINWIKENINDQSVITEAIGEAYTYHARISSDTGLVTVMGWPTHQWQWRGNIDEINIRKNDISNLYTSTDLEQVKNIVEKYNIKYIYVSPLERAAYSELSTEIFEENFEKVYSEEGVTIYKVGD